MGKGGSVKGQMCAAGRWAWHGEKCPEVATCVKKCAVVRYMAGWRGRPTRVAFVECRRCVAGGGVTPVWQKNAGKSSFRQWAACPFSGVVPPLPRPGGAVGTKVPSYENS